MINYIDNMSFQKEYFPDIFDRYKYSEDKKKKGGVHVRESTYLYFLMSDEISLMTHINDCFGINISFDYLASAIIVSFGYENRILRFDDGIVEVSLNHPFLEINHFIVFGHIIINSLLEKSYDLYSFVDKPLKQMMELQIKRYCQDYDYETHNLSSYDEVLDRIVNARPEYEFRYNTVYKENRVFIKYTGFDVKYSLSIIEIIDKTLSKKENEIIQNCVNEVMNGFRISCIDILNKHLQSGEFDINYVIVEKYLQFERKCKQEFSSYFKERLLPSIINYKKYSCDYSARYNEISRNKNILEVDDYMNKKIEDLNELLEAI